MIRGSDFLALILFCSCASAQTFSISGIMGMGSSTDNDYSTSITGAGTATLSPGGNATFSLTGTSTRDRGIGCTAADVVQLSLTFRFNSADSLTILMAGPSGDSSGNTILLSSNFNVMGGTGAYAGKGGSGSTALTITTSGGGGSGEGAGGGTGNKVTFTATGSGSGTLTSQPIAQPTISPSGIVPVFSEVPIVQPGSWISIYGNNFTNSTTIWNDDFPTNLGGVSVTIDNKLGYLWFVSPGQINLQVADDSTQGCVNVVVNTPNGQASYAVVLQPQGPSLNLWADGKHPAAIIYTAAGYDLLGTAGSVPGVTTHPVKVGETISLYGVGFGPTEMPALAGQVYAGPAVNKVLDGVSVTIGGQAANVAFAGLVAEGLYQINVVVPQVPSGDQLVQAVFVFPNPILSDNTQTQNNVYIAVQ